MERLIQNGFGRSDFPIPDFRNSNFPLSFVQVELLGKHIVFAPNVPHHGVCIPVAKRGAQPAVFFHAHFFQGKPLRFPDTHRIAIVGKRS